MDTEQRRRHLVNEYNTYLSMVQDEGFPYTPVIEDPEKAQDADLIRESSTMRWLLRTPHQNR